MVEAADEARRKIERDLHDGAQQRLVGLALDLRLARGRVLTQPEESAKLLDEAIEELAGATAELRELARGIHPAVLTEVASAQRCGRWSPAAALPPTFGEVPEERLPARVEITAYFVVVEGLTNVRALRRGEPRLGGGRPRRRHARGRGRRRRDWRRRPRGWHRPARPRSRVTALDGRLDLSSAEGEGTILRAEIPCAS